MRASWYTHDLLHQIQNDWNPLLARCNHATDVEGPDFLYRAKVDREGRRGDGEVVCLRSGVGVPRKTTGWS